MAKYQLNNTSKYKQGQYNIKNPLKYMGDPTDILYRSSWELKFMQYCDINSGIIKWGSEIFKIPYVDHLGKNHIYIPDFYLETLNKDNPLLMNRFLVEIKPEQETREPIIPKNLTDKKLKGLEYQVATWQKNKYKWAYTQEWCKNRDIKFWLITEENLSSFRP